MTPEQIVSLPSFDIGFEWNRPAEYLSQHDRARAEIVRGRLGSLGMVSRREAAEMVESEHASIYDHDWAVPATPATVTSEPIREWESY